MVYYLTHEGKLRKFETVKDLISWLSLNHTEEFWNVVRDEEFLANAIG